LLEDADKNLSKQQQMLSMLKLLTIIFYPEKDDNMFAVCDYSIGEDLTDDLIAVKLYKDGHIRIDIES
jgi:ATP-dependent exoDNAse (exonuclease V) beta subunit